MTIVNAGPEHVETLAALFNAYRVFYGQPAALDRARALIGERVSRGDSVLFLAQAGAVPLGFTQLYPSFSSVRTKRLWILNDLYVVPEARQRGVATALIERARRLAAETNACGLALETARDNVPAQALYEKAGFVRDTAFYRYFLPVQDA